MAEMASRRPEKIHALTSLRFFAALFVVLFHTLWSFLPFVRHESWFGRFISLGFISVSFFFLLSGYILGVVYLRSGIPLRPKDFLRARFARIYPLFFLTLVLDTPNLFLARLGTYGLKAAVVKTSISFLGNATMLHAWLLQLRGIDNPNWSLSVETLFYLSFPLLGVALWKLRGWSLWLVAALLYAGGQAVVMLVAPHINFDLAKFFPMLHLSTFALGILLARWQSLQTAGTGTRGIWPWVISLLSAAALAAVVTSSIPLPNANMYDGLMAPIFIGVIWAFSKDDWLPARLLQARWLVVLGEASFGLYLFHIPVFHLFEHLNWNAVTPLFPLYLAIAIGVSVLSFYFYETPMRKWILKQRRIHNKETMETASSAQ